ncbi:putative reverse transcriptase domain-containing protein, partial [Tanacetum coccineum]
ISGALTNKAVRNGTIKKVEKRGNVEEPSKDMNGRDDNKRTMTVNAFATTVNPVGKENTGTWPKCTTFNSYHAPGGPCRTCYNCNRPGHLAKDCRSVPRNVNPFNARNPPVRACYECGSTEHGQGRVNQGNQARGRAFMLGAEEACQDPNIVTGLEPSDLGFKYEIEIASGQLVEIDKVIKEFTTRVRQDTDEIYTMLDDEQSERQLMAGRLNMLYRDRRAHSRTARLMEAKARMSQEAWGRSMDASDLARVEVMSLRIQVVAQ